MKRIKKRLPKELVQAQIESFSHDGRGIARINGKTTFITGALEHEIVSFIYTRKKKDFDEGVVSSIEKASEFRIEPACQHYEICGGCSLQHLANDAQINAKQTALLDGLKRIGKAVPKNILTPIAGENWHYRNKARLSCRYVEKKGDVLVGFREKNNARYIADIHTCLVLNKKVADEIDNLRKLLASFSDPKSIAQIEVAAGDEEVGLIFRNLAELTENDKGNIRNFADKTKFKIYLQPSGEDSVHLFYPENVTDFLTYSIPDYNVQYKFKPTDFTQVNSSINQQMIVKALEYLNIQDTDVVLDLFCGLGNFSLPIALNCKKVIAVEGSSAMVVRGKMNSLENSIENIDFLAVNLDEENTLDNPIYKEANKMLLDPPRIGALALVKQIGKLNIQRIVYISCNPITLARDTDILVNQLGYNLLAAGVMDMFPNTAHVESIAVFVKE